MGTHIPYRLRTVLHYSMPHQCYRSDSVVYDMTCDNQADIARSRGDEPVELGRQAGRHSCRQLGTRVGVLDAEDLALWCARAIRSPREYGTTTLTSALSLGSSRSTSASSNGQPSPGPRRHDHRLRLGQLQALQVDLVRGSPPC